jgi:hypothetical protein
MPSLRITFSLSSDDTELIAALQRIPDRARSTVIRQCLAAALLPGGYYEVLETLRQLERHLQRLPESPVVDPPAPTDPAWAVSVADQWDQALQAFSSDPSS